MHMSFMKIDISYNKYLAIYQILGLTFIIVPEKNIQFFCHVLLKITLYIKITVKKIVFLFNFL